MANIKRIEYSSQLNGITHYCVIRRDSDNLFLDSTSGTFITFSAPTCYLPMIEDTIIKGDYSYTDNRTVWQDGSYTTVVYLQYGDIPDHYNDLKVAESTFIINNDIQIGVNVGTIISIYNDVKRILGLLHENIYMDEAVYDEHGNLVSCRVRIYTDSISVGTNNNVLATYTITSQSSGPGRFTTWSQIRN